MSDSISESSNFDDHVDDEIAACLDVEKAQSFFLFAGAGSGKTRSLVSALTTLRSKIGPKLRLHAQRIGVITYTNAASDEIKRRLDYDPLIEVSTIHSFVWALIKGFDNDIRAWLRITLQADIKELEDLEARGRTGTKASVDRLISIQSKNKRLAELGSIRRFVYSPTGDNRGRDSLSHSEVIKISSEFLAEKPLMQRLLIRQFPILLIDECQDTNKELVDALLAVQQAHGTQFCLGLIGDTMQRIYNDGKVRIEDSLPDGWAKPAKVLNHRCPPRVVKLINRVRSDVDDQKQKVVDGKNDGVVRFFSLSSDITDKPKAEATAAAAMARMTGDNNWLVADMCKTLTLEHSMAAKRMQFLELFAPLAAVDRLKTGLLDGTLPIVRFFIHIILPLVKAKQCGDEFAVAKNVREFSPILSKLALKSAEDAASQLQKANDAVNNLARLWDNEATPTILEVLRNIAATGLFEIPEILVPSAVRDESMIQNPDDSDSDNDADRPTEVAEAIDKFLMAPFSQIEPYAKYVAGIAPFDTHQGVKGLQFDRVMVIMDDSDAGGFLFSYDKLFGAKEKTRTDLTNEREGKETTIDRTRRLFYVTCSRAKESLALIAYSSDPQKVCDTLVSSGWFDENEVQVGLQSSANA
jgi:DNA helicase-2/ATP-dependent DNA helicase PcrA